MEVVHPMSFETLFHFERELAEFTGAPYVVLTDGCTHAIELCLRLDHVTSCDFTAFTYLSIPQLMHQLGIHYELKTEYWSSFGEYQFHGTNIWDSARLFMPGMYRPGQKQCLSFGHGKPMQLGKCGAILLDNHSEYQQLSMMRSDGRDLRIEPWESQQRYSQGWHYCPTLETVAQGREALRNVIPMRQQVKYPDLRKIEIIV